jgi:flagellar FliL protein
VKKMLPWILVIVLTVTLLAWSAFILWNHFQQSAPTDPRDASKKIDAPVEQKHIPANERAEMSFPIDDVVVNLADPQYFVNVSFTFEMDSVEAKKEIELLSFKIKNEINTTLMDTLPDNIRGSKGVDALSATLINRTNTLLTEGKVRSIYVTKLIITAQ